MSRRMQRIDLGLASPYGAISAVTLAALEISCTGAESYATYDGATGNFKQQTREEFGEALRADLAAAVARPEFVEPLAVTLKTSAAPRPELLDLTAARQPVQTLAEIMAQQKAGIEPKKAAAPPPPVAAPPSPTPSHIQTWISPKTAAEERAAIARAIVEEEMTNERKAAYHKRRQEALKEAGAPQCYRCGWYGHIGRVCRNEDTRPQQRPRPQPVEGQRRGVRLADFLGEL